MLLPVEIRLYPPVSYQIKEGNIYFTCKTSDKNKIFSEEVVNFINVGVKTTFSYYITFYEVDLFLDKEIKKIIIHKRIEHDMWSERYLVETDYLTKKKAYIKDLNKIIYDFTRLNDMYLISLASIDKNKKYYFKTRMTLKITQPYSYMYLIFNFLSIFKYKTTWEKGKDIKGADLIKMAYQ